MAVDSAGVGLLPDRATVRQALAWATPILTAAGVPSPRLDAEVLLAYVLGWTRAQLYARPEHELSGAQRQAFGAVVERRQQREPVPYITGHREFYGLDFAVDRRVLIPRPETELLVERALESARQMASGGQPPLLADVGTGSGIVAVCLAVNVPDALVHATDTSAEALEVAALNAARHGVSEHVQLLHGDLLRALPGPVDVMAANLPYVPTDLLSSLDPDVAQYEPLVALDGGPDGLLYIRRLLSEAGQWLRPGGVVVLEIGAGQGPKVVALASERYPSAKVELFQDYAGLDRVVRVEGIAPALRALQ